MATWVILLALFAVSLPQAALSQRQNGDLRLVGHGANRLSGRLEIYYNGQWGSVCVTENRNAGFDLSEAAVACRQMGLGAVVDAYTINRLPELGSRYGEGSGPIFLGRVRCEGPESHILNCQLFQELGTVSASCSHANDVAIVCSGMSTPYNGEVRLSPVPGSHSIHSQGLVQLHSNNRWASVYFDGGEGERTATASCRQLGYTHAVSYRAHNSSSGTAFWDTTAVCTGAEACLSDCFPSLPTTLATRSCDSIFVQCGYNIAAASSIPRGNHASCRQPQAPLEGAIRLASDEEFSYEYPEGYLEIFKNGAWGVVCHIDFVSLREENVACKQLGYPSASLTTQSGMYDIGNREVYNLSCSGMESTISECNVTQHAGDCTVFEEALFVLCSTSVLPHFGAVTLRDGVGSRGTLLVHREEYFFPVCALGFTATHGEVACRELGYERLVEFKSSSYYTPEPAFYEDKFNNSLLVPKSSCSTQDILVTCLTGPVESSDVCRTGLDEIVLSCSGGSPESDVRLVDGPSPRQGRLEVFFVDEWGSVCANGDRGFGYLEASVVCRTLGYEGADREPYPLERSSDKTTLLDSVVCSGFEESIFDCQHDIGRSNCSQLVGIECSETLRIPDGHLRLIGEGSVSTDTLRTGRLEISYYGVWMTVCSTYFSSQAAEVACRQLGYSSVVDVCRNSSCYGGGQGFIHVAADMCSGDEVRLLDCNRQFYASQLCDHSMDIGLQCARDAPPTTITASPTDPVPFDTLYIILIVVGSVVALVTVVVVVCCVCAVCKCKRKKSEEGTWTAPSHRNGGRPATISANNAATYPESEVMHKKTDVLSKDPQDQYDDSSEGIIERSVNGKRPTSPLEISKGDSPLPSTNHYSLSPSRGREDGSHVYQNVAEIHAAVDEAPPNYDELDLYPSNHAPISASSTGFSSDSSPGATMDSGLGSSTHEHHDQKEDLHQSYVLPADDRHETML